MRFPTAPQWASCTREFKRPPLFHVYLWFVVISSTLNFRTRHQDHDIGGTTTMPCRTSKAQQCHLSISTIN